MQSYVPTMEKFLRQWLLPNSSSSDERNNDPVARHVQEDSLILVTEKNIVPASGNSEGNTPVSGSSITTPIKTFSNTISPMKVATKIAVVPRQKRKQSKTLRQYGTIINSTFHPPYRN